MTDIKSEQPFFKQVADELFNRLKWYKELRLERTYRFEDNVLVEVFLTFHGIHAKSGTAFVVGINQHCVYGLFGGGHKDIIGNVQNKHTRDEIVERAMGFALQKRASVRALAAT